MRILIVDDDAEFCDVAGAMLQMLGHDVTGVHNLQDAIDCLLTDRAGPNSIEHIILDFMLPDGSGLHLIDVVKNLSDKPFITLVTGHPAVKQVVSNLAGPKVNYILKPVTKAGLEQALHQQTLPKASNVIPSIQKHFDCLVGESPVMHKLYEMIGRVSKTSANVLLMGESGVGKEVVAQAIHNASDFPGELIATNCGALSKDLVSSELFGHEKGAFTGAVAKKIGVFEQAQGGSLFLDEVTEMPLDHQSSLLRALETQSIIRVGGAKNIPVRCRVISATNRHEDDIAEKGVLREDVYFRLAVFPIKIPALRERREDIPLLARVFLAQLNSENKTDILISDTQIETLTQYDWPGNIRELKHTIHRSYIMADVAQGEIVLPDDFSSPFSSAAPRSQEGILAPGQTIDSVERELIRLTLQDLNGDKPKAARTLGISLKTLYNRINKYDNLNA